VIRERDPRGSKEFSLFWGLKSRKKKKEKKEEMIVIKILIKILIML